MEIHRCTEWQRERTTSAGGGDGEDGVTSPYILRYRELVYNEHLCWPG
jgi:hypothetical protein